MTREEVQKELDIIADNINKEYQEQVELYNNGCREELKFSRNYIKHNIVVSDEVYPLDDVDSFIEELQELKRIVSEDCSDKISPHIDYRAPRSNYEDCDVDGGYYFVACYELLTEDAVQKRIKEQQRNKLSELLKPESEKYRNAVDCKIAQLFFDGIIDFNALQKLTYTNCSL